MICKPCTVAADFGLPGVHSRCVGPGCGCGHRPLARPPRMPGGGQMRHMLAAAWQPTPAPD